MVLGEHVDAAQTRVQAITEDEIDDAILPTERHRGLGTVARERAERTAPIAGKNNRQGFAENRQGYGPPTCWKY